MDYGFTLKVEDLTSSQMKKIEQSIKSLGGTVKSATAGIQEDFNGLAESANKLQRTLIEAFSVYEIYNFGKELLHLTAEFQGFENVIKYSSEGIVDNARNVGYLTNAIDRLHLPMEEAFKDFSEMQAGFFGTGIEGEKLRKVFEGVGEAASVMHLTPEAFSRTTFAMKEIGELGTVQMRQMRMLAFALPGSMNIAASAMGMTMEKFHEQMKKGAISSADFLPKFAAALTAHFSPGLGNAGQSLISQINDEKNSIIKTMLDMGNSLMPLWKDILTTVSEAMKEIQGLWNGLTGNTNFVVFLKAIFDWGVKLLPIWLTYKGVMLGITFIMPIYTELQEAMTLATMANASATELASVAFEGLSSAIASTGIGALVVGIGLLVENLISMNKELDDAIDKKYRLSESKNDFKSIADQATAIKEQYSVFNSLDPLAKKKLAADVGEFLKETRNKIPVLDQRAMHIDSAAAVKRPGFIEAFGGGAGVGNGIGGLFAGLHQKHENTKFAESAAEMSANIKQLGFNFVDIKTIGQALKKQGYKPTLYASTGGEGSSGKDQAYNTSNLSGAAGGLGQAKIIHIQIGVVQQNNGVSESKTQAEEAVQLLIREINNLSDSQNSM